MHSCRFSEFVTTKCIMRTLIVWRKIINYANQKMGCEIHDFNTCS